MDTTGRFIHSYDGPEGSAIGQLSYPHGLGVDTRGCVYVADYYNDRVVLLSAELTHLGYVALPGLKLFRPRALHLDESNSRLYIGGRSGVVVLGASDL